MLMFLVAGCSHFSSMDHCAPARPSYVWKTSYISSSILEKTHMAMRSNFPDRIGFLVLLLLLLVVSTSSFSSRNIRRGTKGLPRLRPCLFAGDNQNDGGQKNAKKEEDITNSSSSNNTNKQLSRIEAVRKMLRTEAPPVEQRKTERRDIFINFVTAGLVAVFGVAATQLFRTTVYTPAGFQRLPTTQFIAALGDSKASSGVILGDRPWGLWRVDPGPRGVWLKDYETKLRQNDNVAPAGWKFSSDDWWLEEHGLIMETPAFPLPPGRYLVTGGRSVTTGLTVDKLGKWQLDEGTLYDVTHLPCRAARYKGSSPTAANPRDFPVTPGAIMPSVPGAEQQDYAVLFLVGRAKLVS
jgi:hypothetical protein